MGTGRCVRFICLALLFNSVFSFAVEAATINAANCSSSAVQTAINSASNGDTVVIPAGACSWTSGISTSKQIDIEGAGSSATTGTRITHNAGSSTLFDITIGNSYNTKIGNVRFIAGTVSGGKYLNVSGTGKVPLLHDTYFDLANDILAFAVDWDVTGGVIWNCTFESDYNLGGSCGQMIGSGATGCLRIKSKKNWDDASTMGMSDTDGTSNLYIEDCTFSNVGQCPDADDNGRVVIRHSIIDGSGGLTHGPTSSYGGRHVELYDNTITKTLPNRNTGGRLFWFRAGTAVITGNALTDPASGCYSSNVFEFIVENATRSTSHGCCTSWQCWHQPGTGSDGTSGHNNVTSPQTPDSYQISEPVYIWGNSGTGNTVAKMTSMNDQPDDCGNGLHTSNFFQSGRDYYVSTTSSGAKPGWSRYTYPHPLRLSSPPPAAPANLRIVN